MDNQEILKRFDVLYNNITSNLAPGLNAYEKSVFWNKGTIEVLKNRFNPKGNKYAEGFDGSPKRQIDFSEITKIHKFYFDLERPTDTYSQVGWKCIKDNSFKNDILAIVNESLDILDSDIDTYINGAHILLLDQQLPFDINGDGRLTITDRTMYVNYMLAFTNETLREQLKREIETKFDEAWSNDAVDGFLTIDSEYTMKDIVENFGVKSKPLVVVPINNVEFDTLMSRPYKYPPKSQVWRLLVNGEPEFIMHPGELPVRYTIRYIKYPDEVDLTSSIGSEVPQILHDEILQRAVELAKNSWDGNIETHKAFGERSE